MPYHAIMNLCQLIGIDGLIFLELVPWKYEEGAGISRESLLVYNLRQ